MQERERHCLPEQVFPSTKVEYGKLAECIKLTEHIKLSEDLRWPLGPWCTHIPHQESVVFLQKGWQITKLLMINNYCRSWWELCSHGRCFISASEDPQLNLGLK